MGWNLLTVEKNLLLFLLVIASLRCIFSLCGFHPYVQESILGRNYAVIDGGLGILRICIK